MEHSFGIIPLRVIGKKWQTLLVKHAKGHWSFPKGHPESREEGEEAAIRELQEETGLRVQQLLPLEPFHEFYRYKKEEKLIEKAVTYYAAAVEGEVLCQEAEIVDYRWVSLEEAEALMTFKEGKDLVHLLLTKIEMK